MSSAGVPDGRPIPSPRRASANQVRSVHHLKKSLGLKVPFGMQQRADALIE